MEDNGMKTTVVINQYCKLNSNAIHSKNIPIKAQESASSEEELHQDSYPQESLPIYPAFTQEVDKSINFY